MTRIRQSLFVVASVLLSPLAMAQFGPADVSSQQVGDDLHVIFAPGSGNMLVSIGEDGVLMVDDGVPDVVVQYMEAIAELGGDGVDLVINTHGHFDHADGNKVHGPNGTQIVAHENARNLVMQDISINLGNGQTFEQAAHAPDAWPSVTYDDSMRVYFNGDQIDLLHPGPGHTNGDTAVIFTDRNLVHLGDVFNMSGYPFVDADHGGSLIGIAEFCDRVLEELEPGATVIPGHGDVGNYDDLTEYAATLRTIYERISALVEDGASLEQVIAAAPTAEWDDAMGSPAGLIDRTYASLTR